jgi:ATP-binding cassette, subfamily B, bacterial HlyB/CyaB
MESTDNTKTSALKSIIMLLRLMNKTADQAKEFFDKTETVSADNIVDFFVSKKGLRAKKKKVKISKLCKIQTPFIAELSSGFSVVAKVDQDKIIFENPEKDGVEKYTLPEFEKIYNQQIISVSEKVPGKNTNVEFGISWFLSAFRENRLISSQILLSAFVLQIFVLTTPLFTLIIIDKVFNSGGKSTLDVLVMGVIAMALFDFIIGTSRRRLLQFTSNKIDIDLMKSLFAHLLSLPMTFFSQKQTGDTISRLKEIETVRNFITGNAITLLIDFPFIFVLLIVMYFFSPLLFFVVISSILISLTIFGIASPVLKKRLKEKQALSADTQSFLYEIVTGMETVKALSVEQKIHADLAKDLTGQTISSMQTENISGHVTQLAGLLNKITVAVCLWLGALQVLELEMTAGQLIAFNMLVGRVLGPSQRIAMMLQQIQNIRVSIGRIKEIFDVLPEPAIHKSRASLPELKGAVKFENVLFSYSPNSQPVLENINLYVPPGQIVGVVGISGSGKSSLMRLIQRLYIPGKGKVYMDGINIAGIDPSWLRSNIGAVTQDNVLLNRSIKDNIALAGSDVSMEQIQKAAMLSGADRFIKELPELYDTIVGEKGQMLSAGQRQRIALARALVNDPKILILDEATSSLDYISEHEIQRNMKKICENRTVFVVAHRFSTIRIAHRIITMNKGRIIEDGTIPTLLKQRGPFAKLYAMQDMNFQKQTRKPAQKDTRGTDNSICSAVF